jgi:hypothetical protein
MTLILLPPAASHQPPASSRMKTVTPRAQLDEFIGRYSPGVAEPARAAFAVMRRRLPAAHVLVYDNYNALAIGFAITERSSDIVFSLTLYPRWLSLFFAKGRGLPDPHKRLQGGGSTIRHVVLESARTLDEVPIRELMNQALRRAGTTLSEGKRGALIIKSISAKQRPRRPRTTA